MNIDIANHDITIRIDEDIFDPLVMGQRDLVHQLLKLAEVATANGRKVTVIRTSTNAPDTIIRTLTAPDEAREWWKKLEKIHG